MTDTTWMKHRVPSSVILGLDDDSPDDVASSQQTEALGGVGSVLSDHAAAMTWKLCKEGHVAREEMPKRVMGAVVASLLE